MTVWPAGPVVAVQSLVALLSSNWQGWDVPSQALTNEMAIGAPHGSVVGVDSGPPGRDSRKISDAPVPDSTPSAVKRGEATGVPLTFTVLSKATVRGACPVRPSLTWVPGRAATIAVVRVVVSRWAACSRVSPG